MQSLGEAIDRGERRIPAPALRRGDVGPFEAGVEGKLLLRQSALFAQVSEPMPELDQLRAHLSLHRRSVGRPCLTDNVLKVPFPSRTCLIGQLSSKRTRREAVERADRGR